MPSCVYPTNTTTRRIPTKQQSNQPTSPNDINPQSKGSIKENRYPAQPNVKLPPYRAGLSIGGHYKGT